MNQPDDDAGNFRDHARFTLDHLPRLTTRPEHVPQLRQTILNLAVRGKLVAQDVNDESSVELMRRIKAGRLIASRDGRASSKASSSELGESDTLFEIPNSWRWVRAEDLCHCVVSGSTPPQEVFHTNTGAPFLKVYNIREQRVDFEYKKQFIDFGYHSSKSKRSILYPGDVLMNIVGPPLGKIAIVPNEYPEWNCNQAITAFRPVLPEMAAYLYTFFREGSFLRKIELIGTAGQDNISVTKCRNIAVPLPPLNEQRRIVAKVDELMALCDRLQSQLTTTQAESRRLLEAVLHEALEPVR